MGEVGSTIETCTEPKVARSLTEHFLSNQLLVIGMYLDQISKPGLSSNQIEERCEKIRQKRNDLFHKISMLSNRMLESRHEEASKRLKMIANMLGDMSIPDTQLKVVVFERWDILKKAF